MINDGACDFALGFCYWECVFCHLNGPCDYGSCCDAFFWTNYGCYNDRALVEAKGVFFFLRSWISLAVQESLEDLIWQALALVKG